MRDGEKPDCEGLRAPGVSWMSWQGRGCCWLLLGRFQANIPVNFGGIADPDIMRSAAVWGIAGKTLAAFSLKPHPFAGFVVRRPTTFHRV